MPGASRGLAQKAGFAAGADLVLLIGAPGLLHPQAGAALLRMSEAHEGRALMEVACAPGRRLRPADSQDFGLPWVAGPRSPSLVRSTTRSAGITSAWGARRPIRTTRSAPGRTALTCCSVPARYSTPTRSVRGSGS